MNRFMALAMSLTLVAGLGCDKKKATPETPGVTSPTGTPPTDGKGTPSKDGSATPPPTAEVKPKYADTSALWALAPADATYGVVVGDGVGARVLDVLATHRKKLEAKPFAKKALEKLDAWRKEQPIDIFDPAAYQAKGIDPAKGMAVFGGADPEKPSLVIIPVGDLASFRKTVEATTEKVGDREIDKVKELVCTTIATRYACAPTQAVLDAAAKAHDSPLAAAVKALPAEGRGDLEGYIDLVKTPKAAEALSQVKPFGDFTTAGGAARLDLTAFNMHVWAKGTMSPIAQMVAAAAPAPELANLTAGATTVLRAKIDPRLLLGQAPPSLPVGNADVRTDLLDQLTGDVQIVTAGKGLLAGAIMLKVNDTAKVKKLLAAVCAEAKKPGQLPVSSIVAKDDSCTGEVSLAQLKEAIGVELPPFKFNFAVTGPLLVLAFGDLDPASLKGSVADAAGSPEARDALTGAQTATFWTRSLDIDVAALPKELTSKAMAQPEVADVIALMNWSGAQAYEMSLSAGVTTTGAKATLHVTSMEADAAEPRAAYFAAVDKRIAGDRAGYGAALADIEKKFPGSLAAKRAALERTGTPVVGPVGGMVVGGAASAFLFLKMAEELAKPTPGFGEPQPEPAAGGDAGAATEETKPDPTAKPPEPEVKPDTAAKPPEGEVKPDTAAKPPEGETKPDTAAKPPEGETKPDTAAKPETSPPPPPPKP